MADNKDDQRKPLTNNESKKGPTDDQAAKHDPNADLTALRDILFGQAEHQIRRRLAEIEQTMLDKFDAVNQSIDKQFAELKAQIEQDKRHHEAQLDAFNNNHEEAEANLKEFADKLASELEMSDTNNRQEADEINKRIERELQLLNEKYDQKFVEALAKLDSVTKELSSSKTDRKTLANLLATMAVNLETDQ